MKNEVTERVNGDFGFVVLGRISYKVDLGQGADQPNDGHGRGFKNNCI